jgi:hypothetical protein
MASPKPAGLERYRAEMRAAAVTMAEQFIENGLPEWGQALYRLIADGLDRP